MRKILKWGPRVLILLLVVAAVIGLWKREQITRLLAVNSLFKAEKIVNNFSNMNTMFLSTDLVTGPASPLPVGAQMTLPPETAQWIDDRNVTSIVVLHYGTLVHQSYHLDTAEDDLRISWSVAKSFLSTLIGILLDEGAIDSIDDPVTKYAPALADSAYRDATLRNVLNMSSGVTFDEDYLDPKSDINKMGRILALGGSMDGFASGLTDSFAAPGETWQYVSIDTHVIGMVARGATGRNVPDLLSEKIITPLGLEAAPYYVTDGNGVAFVLGGLNLTTRDYARFGQMIAQGGMWQGQQIVPPDWITASIAPSAPTAQGATRYGYQWWIPPTFSSGEVIARGVYGQYIYINTDANIVIATTAADRQFRASGVAAQNEAMFQSIAASLE